MWLNAIQNILFWLTGLSILALIPLYFIGQIPLPLRIHIIFVSIIIIGLEIKQVFKITKVTYDIDDSPITIRDRDKKIAYMQKAEVDNIKPQIQVTKEKICTYPGCYGTMRIRTAKDGKKYWVCCEYNKCKTAMAVEEPGA